MGATLLHWAEQLAEALHWIHSHPPAGRTPIHWDVKRQNVLLTPEGDIRLIDFGIFKVGGRSVTSGPRDRYDFAPEQRLPTKTGAYEEDDLVEPRPESDLYCLGLILFGLAIGHSAVPAAQQRLREDQVRFDHLARLKQNGKGLLGEIGGLTSKERTELGKAYSASFPATSARHSSSRDDLACPISR